MCRWPRFPHEHVLHDPVYVVLLRRIRWPAVGMVRADDGYGGGGASLRARTVRRLLFRAVVVRYSSRIIMVRRVYLVLVRGVGRGVGRVGWGVRRGVGGVRRSVGGVRRGVSARREHRATEHCATVALLHILSGHHGRRGVSLCWLYLTHRVCVG